ERHDRLDEVRLVGLPFALRLRDHRGHVARSCEQLRRGRRCRRGRLLGQRRRGEQRENRCNQTYAHGRLLWSGFYCQRRRYFAARMSTLLISDAFASRSGALAISAAATRPEVRLPARIVLGRVEDAEGRLAHPDCELQAARNSDMHAKLRDLMTRRISAVSAISAVAFPLALAWAVPLQAQPLPRGTIIDSVTCADDSTQSYALYLPSSYSPDRAWSLLIAFHPAARGRAMVETYQAAAERYGYIVAGSNSSRNGPVAVSAASVRAMSGDLGQRFAIDADRIYLTGLSGGARIALQVALGNRNIAGVIASSAGYPDSKPRSSLTFPIFGTAGTDDFNYIEKRQLDRKLTTPHPLEVFNGGHALPPDSVALDAIEWMELQAMKSGRKPKDDAVIDRLLEKRRKRIAESTDAAATRHLLEALADAFKGLRDGTAETSRARALG